MFGAAKLANYKDRLKMQMCSTRKHVDNLDN